VTLFYQTTCSADYPLSCATAGSRVVATVTTCLKLDSTHFTSKYCRKLHILT